MTKYQCEWCGAVFDSDDCDDFMGFSPCCEWSVKEYNQKAQGKGRFKKI